MMLETLKHVRNVLEEKKYMIHGEKVSANFKLSLQKKPMVNAQALFFKVLAEAKGETDNIWSSWSKIEVSFFAEVGPDRGRELAAKYVVEGRMETFSGRVDKGLCIFREGVVRVTLERQLTRGPFAMGCSL